MGDPVSDRHDVCDLLSEGRIMYKMSQEGLDHGVFDIDVCRVLDDYELMLGRCPDSHISEVRTLVERFVTQMRHTMRDRFTQS